MSQNQTSEPVKESAFGVGTKFLKKVLMIPDKWEVIDMNFSMEKQLLVIRVKGDKLPTKKYLRPKYVLGDDGMPECVKWVDADNS